MKITSSAGVSLGQPIPLTCLSGTLFQLPLPEGWKDKSIYSASGMLESGSPVSVTVVAEEVPDLVDLRDHVVIQKQQLSGQLLNFGLSPGPEQPSCDGEGFRLDYTWTTPEKISVRQMQFYFHKPPNVWILTVTAPAQSAPDLESLFAQFCSDFRVRR